MDRAISQRLHSHSAAGLALCLASTAWIASAAALDQPARLSFHLGYWSADVEWQNRSGVFVAAGQPWLLATIADYDDQKYPYFPPAFHLHVGYDWLVGGRWHLRGSARLLALSVDNDSICPQCDLGWGFMALVEAGIRCQYPSGFVYGIQLPLDLVAPVQLAFYPNAHVLAPLSLLFFQVYVGWSFDF